MIMVDGKEHLWIAEIKERGWTDGLIRKNLGDWDAEKRNPHYKSAAPMKLYLKERVERVEGSEEWSAVMAGVERRRESARKAVQTKTRKLVESLEGLHIPLPDLPLYRVTRLACDRYNERQSHRNWDYDLATPKSDPAFVDRITVNYLRHVLSPYEDELARMAGSVGIKKAHVELRRLVYDVISVRFPALAEECERQFSSRSGT